MGISAGWVFLFGGWDILFDGWAVFVRWVGHDGIFSGGCGVGVFVCWVDDFFV